MKNVRVVTLESIVLLEQMKELTTIYLEKKMTITIRLVHDYLQAPASESKPICPPTNSTFSCRHDALFHSRIHRPRNRIWQRMAGCTSVS